jgi:hypothetical protein
VILLLPVFDAIASKTALSILQPTSYCSLASNTAFQTWPNRLEVRTPGSVDRLAAKVNPSSPAFPLNPSFHSANTSLRFALYFPRPRTMELDPESRTGN